MPTLLSVCPAAALPGGEIEIEGTGLEPERSSQPLSAEIAGVPALITLARPNRIVVRLPEGVLPGEVVVSRNGIPSNSLPVHIAIPMAENLHPVANPAADKEGNVFTTLSGSRGQSTPVSVFKIAPAPAGVIHELRPFVREILNPSGLAFGPDGHLYVSSRAEGTIYRISPAGDVQTFAEGLGIATGIAFDDTGDLYVGDRSGTIFKIRPAQGALLSSVPLEPEPDTPQETFVFATLEPSISAYHLAFDSHGTLFVTGPTTSSRQSIHAIDRDGTPRVFFRGLGRAQGLAFDRDDNLYVAASLGGNRGIVRITPSGEASLIVSGSNLVGLCFLSKGRAALTTRDAVFSVDLGVRGRGLAD